MCTYLQVTLWGSVLVTFRGCNALDLCSIFNNCLHLCTVSELAKRNIAAFSYFFDLAVDHGLVTDGRTEALVKVGDYETIARRACAPGGGEHRFACMDLSYIYALLTEGYGLPREKELHLYKKIHGHEASWALGLAYNILETK